MHSALSAILMNIPQGISVFPAKPIYPTDAPPVINDLLPLPNLRICVFPCELLHQADTVCFRIAIYGTDTPDRIPFVPLSATPEVLARFFYPSVRSRQVPDSPNYASFVSGTPVTAFYGKAHRRIFQI